MKKAGSVAVAATGNGGGASSSDTPLSLATSILHPEKCFIDPYNALSTPLYQVRRVSSCTNKKLIVSDGNAKLLHLNSTSSLSPSLAVLKTLKTATFGQPTSVDMGPYDYTRSGNPTRAQLESQIAALEGVPRLNTDEGAGSSSSPSFPSFDGGALAFTSGMAALAAALRLAPSGTRVVAGDDLYGGTSRLLAQVAPQCGVEVRNVDTSDAAAVEAALFDPSDPKPVSLLLLESPTNPRMQVADIRRLCALARRAGAISLVDNSILTPVFQSPLLLGADVSMTSATKFVGGHSDVTAGLLAVKGAALYKRLYFYQNAEGAGLSPFDSWLCLRGLKTMPLRMRAAASNAAALAAFLEGHPLVKKVNFPGLATHPGRDVHASQSSSPGSLLSFETGNVELSRGVVERTKLFAIAVSFGSVASQISLPCFMSHASIPAAVRAERGLPDDLVRISAGVEDAGDLLRDLEAAFIETAGELGLEGAPPRGRAEESLARAAKGREQELEAQVALLKAELARAARTAASTR
jgi:cystathionine beta-lyase